MHTNEYEILSTLIKHGALNILELRNAVSKDYEHIELRGHLNLYLDGLILNNLLESQQEKGKEYPNQSYVPFQITEKGVKEFNEESEKRIQEAIKKKLEIKLMEANLNNLEITKRLYYINWAIAISTGIAAFYYILEILRTQYQLGLPNHIYFR